MKYIIIFLLGFVCLTIQKVKAQSEKVKKDTVYYHLDTTAIPIKDRMFAIDEEAGTVSYVLLCKCYPWETDLRFFYTKGKNTKSISKEEFSKIKTISITQLIEIAVKYAKDRIDRHTFFFILPNGKNMKVTKAYLSDPRKPRAPTITVETVNPN
ncbi:hypothetical protein [Pedobacter cryoconitis]|uniref:Uncharacterized protein n=1 Tax=Pedobacter cryoconitis TaxID=188932 RepID=A0A7X0JAH9_9SPHI|nr:hypothetical protein [Pedobacter cryoconitis]MBB6502811.1 hypothetical protein [Pedobacter cryoconitis]